jgi:hypothetical protein
MAQENSVDINVNVQGNAVQSIGNVKKALKEANAELINAQSNFGDYSQEAINAAKRVAELKDRISEARETADLFDPGKKFQALAGAVNAVAGGFTAVQGALGVVGVESEDLQKSLLKVQSALALSQGLSAVTDSAKDFQRLATIVKTNVVSAFSTLRGALIATGIGALAIGIGLVAANFDKVKKAVLNLVPGLAQVGTFFSSIITKVTDFVGVTSQAERALASLEKTTKRGNESIEARIKVLTAQGGKEKEIYVENQKLADNELNALRQRLSTTGKLTQDEQKRFRELKTEKAVLDAEEQKRQKEALKDNAKSGANASKQAAEQRKKDNEDKIAAEKEAQEKLANLRNELFLSTFKDENEKKKAELNLAFIKEKDEILANTKITEATRNELIIAARLKLNADLDALAVAQREKKAAEDAKLLEESANQIETENDKEYNQLQAEIAKKNKLNADARKAELDADISLQNAKFEAASAGLNLLSSLAGQNEKIANAIFVIDKALAIAKIVVDTQREIAGYYASNSIFGAAGVAIATKQALVAKIRAGIGIASIAGTTIAKFKGGGAAGGAVGGSSGGAAPSVSASAPLQPPQPQTTTLSNQTINAIGNQATRAYVVESDVTSNQQRIAAIQQRARFG